MSPELHVVMPVAVFLVGLAIIALALVKGGPKPPPPLASINEPFKSVDTSDLPPLERYTARDNAPLAYRRYPNRLARACGSVVLIHGSSASGVSLHTLAKALGAAGYDVYVPDMRGHGESGRKGTIAYIGQLEDDLSDFLDAVQPAGPRTLVGFSAGGGFALRFAGDSRQLVFDRYVLLAPFIHHNAPTTRPGSGGWVSVGVPRTVALTLLNKLRITAFNDLPTVAYALSPEAAARLTPQYSYNLMKNFRPHDNYRADIRATRRPLEVLVGADDEAFRAEAFAGVFVEAGRVVPVTIVPAVGHIGLTLEPAALAEIVAAVSEHVDKAVHA
ncbi:2-succinyl-6-hydroxy-2, 4-cyclohexadiene-1-carboxylate synthase [Paraburkholderia ultramafica]|uniref:2-succinyl-6-hydroxy-2, 4-cyclohexadiene-1-carboxylate synthase n=1 Tax=Paraburkholderia ultramafica TaxID=1544867 RepID=A0A6S7BEE8_9BURK|nr:alpha/beta hydrolase [Paraburkholderia ultramafica]CAB3797265.1 2-succinyl-6-hydroxy-2, 4-cyclohexadiene-1-carboxylate synthase [Paraburkholderia ultramafica]